MPGPVAANSQSTHNADSALEVCRMQLSCMAPISDILGRSPFQLGRGRLACRPALRKVEPTVLQTAVIPGLACVYLYGDQTSPRIHPAL